MSEVERRFRASIYVDVWVEETEDLEVDREKAKDKVSEYQKHIPNSYIGGIAQWRTQEMEKLL